jgi:undecaprenyl-diphosphatase
VLVLTVASVVLADLLAMAIQAGVGRPRPPQQAPFPPALVHLPLTGSFPSGHAATSFAGAAALALACRGLALPGVLLAAAIAFSRLYAGVHYPLDVIAGALLGVAVALAVRLAARASRWPLSR